MLSVDQNGFINRLFWDFFKQAFNQFCSYNCFGISIFQFMTGKFLPLSISYPLTLKKFSSIPLIRVVGFVFIEILCNSVRTSIKWNGHRRAIWKPIFKIGDLLICKWWRFFVIIVSTMPAKLSGFSWNIKTIGTQWRKLLLMLYIILSMEVSIPTRAMIPSAIITRVKIERNKLARTLDQASKKFRSNSSANQRYKTWPGLTRISITDT